MKVTRLADRHAAAIEECLLDAPLINLFLLAYLDAVPISRSYWYGVVDGDRVRAATVVVPGRLLVPWAPDPAHATAIGKLIRARHRPSMTVGPRAACDAVWAAWAPTTAVDRFHDQRLHLCDVAPDGPAIPGFRRAHPSDVDTLVVQSDQMEWEDIGRRPLDEDAEAYAASVRRRVEHGQTYVVARGDEILFQINVGTVTRWGVQVGGTYVPPAHRGQGIATAAMRQLCRVLLADHPVVTLHVHETNLPAVRAYQRCGFRADAAFRLITVQRAAR